MVSRGDKPDFSKIPAEWLEECEAAARRPPDIERHALRGEESRAVCGRRGDAASLASGSAARRPPAIEVHHLRGEDAVTSLVVLKTRQGLPCHPLPCHPWATRGPRP